MSEPRLRLALLILLILFLPASWSPAQTELILPASDAVTGWQQSERVSFTHDDLFSLVNGQAESFFAYGFERVDVQRYQNDSGGQVNVEVWRLADPGGAYGLWTAMRSGAPAGVGIDSDSDGARRLAFWQDSAFVQVTANQPLETSQLETFARAVASSLPEGGERPALLERHAERRIGDDFAAAPAHAVDRHAPPGVAPQRDLDVAVRRRHPHRVVRCRHDIAVRE